MGTDPNSKVKKINLSYIDMKRQNRDRKIPARFLKMAIENGCKYLSLYPNQVDGNLGLDQASSLIYLKLQNPKKDYFTKCSVSKVSYNRILRVPVIPLGIKSTS